MGFGLDKSGSILGKDRIFFSFHNVQIGSGVHSASYPVHSGALSPEVRWPWRETHQSPPSSAQVKIGGAVPHSPIPPCTVLCSKSNCIRFDTTNWLHTVGTNIYKRCTSGSRPDTLNERSEEICLSQAFFYLSFIWMPLPLKNNLKYFYSVHVKEPGYRDWLWPGRPTGRSSSSSRVKNFLFSTSSRPALGSTQPPIQRVSGALSPGVKRPGREAGHSPPASAEVKKMWIYTSTAPYTFMA
jgi:hypothetical protein